MRAPGRSPNQGKTRVKLGHMPPAHWAARRTPSLPALDTHLRWFVRYQILGEEVSEIARTDYAVKRTVDKAITQTCRMLDLARRRGRGRPPKTD